jgi:hypothetical protein
MHKHLLTFISGTAGIILLVGIVALTPTRQVCAKPADISYAEDIAPIFKGWCVSCHQPGGEGFKASGVDLRTYQSVMKGTKFGPVIIPGQPDTSSLIALIYGRTAPQIRMPYGHKPLPGCLRNNIWSWIFEGAKDN